MRFLKNYIKVLKIDGKYCKLHKITENYRKNTKNYKKLQ